jgi:2-hydroxycyclohexanecarboxyl-CoA dehydrogenase
MTRERRWAAGARLTRYGGNTEHPALRLGGGLVAMEMQDRAVVVTGGASGIGRATALLLAREGARVVIGDIDRERGQTVATEAAGAGLTVEFLPLDLTRSVDITEFAAAVEQRVGRVDGLVNGAGWDRIQPFLENPPEMWDQLIAINLLGAVRLTRALLPPMVTERRGKIVNISSDAGRVGSTGETVYAAAKGGLIAFTKSLARELARYHINVNCVSPGPTDTPLFQGQPERMREALTRAIPFRRIAQPEEIAEAVMFFLGRRSDYITGQVLSVSGGLTMVD